MENRRWTTFLYDCGFMDGQEDCRFYEAREASLTCSLIKHASDLKCNICRFPIVVFISALQY
jgi:hypothetical protein